MNYTTFYFVQKNSIGEVLQTKTAQIILNKTKPKWTQLAEYCWKYLPAGFQPEFFEEA